MTSDPIATLRQQLQTLRQQHQTGALDEQTYDSRRAPLERALLDRLTAADTTAAAPTPRPSLRLLGTLTAIVVGVAAGGYAWTGAPGLLGVGPADSATARQAAEAPAGDTPLTMEQLATLTERLAARMKAQPDDPVGWGMLGRAYSLLGRNPDAIAAYQKALALRSDDAQLLADYADAVAVRNGRSMAGEPTKLVERALTLDPDNLKALSLAGTAAFDRQDYGTAVRHWERMLGAGATDPTLVQQVKASIAEARQRGGLAAEPPAAAASGAAPAVVATAGSTAASSPADTPSGPAAASVSGTVRLAPALAARAAPDDTVFIYARAAEGPRMPLAVLRKKVSELPISFRLDDSLAMSPAMRLSGFAQLVVGARVSKSGQALPQPGDLMGQTAPVAVGSQGLQIEIAEEVPR